MKNITIEIPELPSQKLQVIVKSVKDGVINTIGQTGIEGRFLLNNGKQCEKDGTESNWQFWKVQEFDLVKLQKETE